MINPFKLNKQKKRLKTLKEVLAGYKEIHDECKADIESGEGSEEYLAKTKVQMNKAKEKIKYVTSEIEAIKKAFPML